MAYVALYWSVMIFGYFIGSKVRSRADKFSFVNAVMMICISLLVFLMGIRMGSNEEVIRSLGTIGMQSLILTVLLMVGTVVFVSLTRRILGFDKYGVLKGGSAPEGAEGAAPVLAAEDAAGEAGMSASPVEKLDGAAGAGSAAVWETEKAERSFDGGKEEEGGSSNLMTWLILIFVTLGLVVGYFLIRTHVQDLEDFNVKAGNMMTAGLSAMLLVIGFDMGIEGTVIGHIRSAGLRVLAFPAAVLVGTGVTGVLISFLFADLSIKECLAICYGFGWYTFAPVSIANEGYIIAGAISFMHNVFREVGGIMLIPLLAKRIGFIEVTSLAGVAGMDICMPIVEKVARPDIVVYSFAIGMAESLMVPLLVPMIIGM